MGYSIKSRIGDRHRCSTPQQDTADLLEEERGLEVKVPRSGKMDWRPVRESIAAHGMRNSNVLAIAPTATISNIMGTTPCIEPNYTNLFVKSNLGGDFTVLNPVLVNDLKKEGLWDKDMIDQLKYFNGEQHRRPVGVLDEARRVRGRGAVSNQLANIEGIPDHLKQIHQTVFEQHRRPVGVLGHARRVRFLAEESNQVGYEAIIDAAARRQKWIDQSQSVNLFLAKPDTGCECPQQPEPDMYRHAWHTGLKTTYYLRTRQASDIEKSTVAKADKKQYTPEEVRACSIEAMMNGEECEACQ